nr:MaoC/PaaZ C-terminal domain-containing protein [Amylibacter sp.]
MPLNVDTLINYPFPEIVTELTPRDACLYALGIGIGANPTDPAQLRFVNENGCGEIGFRAVPTQPLTMGFFRWVLTPGLGLDVNRVVHGEDRITLHGPIPTTGRVVSKFEIVSVEDKGEGRGAVVHCRWVTRQEGSDTAFATVEMKNFCRGDGGCGNAGAPSPITTSIPDTRASREATVNIRPDAALLYRLSGDLNPLHIDPAYAKSAGFDRPILHGRCSLAIAARAVWESTCPPEAIKQISCRFTAPVYPGESLRILMWDGENNVHFRALSCETGKTVIDNGQVLYGI